MLSVEYGPFPALERAFVARLKELAAPRPGRGLIAVIAPSRRLADRLERLAAVEAGLALLDVRFLTFYSLAVELLDETGWPDDELIGDPVFHDKVVDGLLEADAELFDLFGGGRRPKALASALRASLRDLVDAGVDAGSVREHFGEELLGDAAERRRFLALLRLAQSYERRLKELGALSQSDLTRLATAAVASSRRLDRLEGALYYGFYDLTGLQLEFFRAVAGRCPTTLFFPYRSGHPAFRFADAFFEENLGGARRTALEPALGDTAIGPALDRLFSPDSSGEPLPRPARLSIVNASGQRDEIWACAKEILRLVEEEGASFEGIGVVARAVEPYRGALEDVFADNRIPLSLACQRPLLGHPLAKGALNLLLLRRRDFPAQTVAELVGSPYLRAGAGLRRAGRWRRLIRRLGITAGWLQWQGKLEAPAPGAPGAQDWTNDAAALWRLVSGWRGALAFSGRTWSGLAAQVREFLERHWGAPEDAADDERAAWDAVLAAVDSLRAFDRLGSEVSLPEMLETLEEKLRRASLPAGGSGRGVRAMGAMDARGESFEHLFLVGLKEKGFPRQVQEDPLLRDEARAALKHPAGYWIARKAAGFDEERLLFYLMASSATRRLHCVYPRSDETGRAEVPSLYLRELCRAAGVSLSDETVNWRVFRQPAQRLERCRWELLSPKEASLRLSAAGRSPAPYLAAAGRDAAALEEALARLPALGSFGEAGPWDGLIGPPAGLAAALEREGISPSALDQLAQCPFQFFADRLLGLGAPDDPSEKGELAAWVRGRVYHEALEEFYQSLPAAAWSEEGGNHAPALHRAIDQAFARYGWREMGVYPVLWQAHREAMTAALESFAAWDLARLRQAGLRPRAFELEVSGRAPVPLASGGSLLLRGRLDRLDADEAGKRLRVVDYKTRWRAAGSISKLIEAGELHQLPVYAELAGAQAAPGGEVWAEILAVEDSPEENGRPRSHALSAQEWRKGRDPFFAALSRRVEQALEGRFLIRPDDGEHGHCRRCGFSALCRKGHWPSRRRAAAMERAA